VQHVFLPASSVAPFSVLKHEPEEATDLSPLFHSQL